MDSYDILTDISEHATLIQLVYYLGNVNHAISVVGYRIFDSNHKKYLYLIDNHWIWFVPPYVGKE